MPLKVEPMDEPVLNLTPMIDVVFNLLIFFMIGTRFTDMERDLKLKLPEVAEAAETKPLTAPDPIVVNVSQAGALIVEQRELSPLQLKAFLEKRREQYKDQTVVLRGDGRGSYQRVMDVLDLCHQAKIVNISLAAQLNPEHAP